MTRRALSLILGLGAGAATREIAIALGRVWQGVIAAVHSWHRALLDSDTTRRDRVTALGLDEIGVSRCGR